MRQNSFGCADEIDAWEFEPLRAVNRHERDGIGIFIVHQLGHFRMLRGHLVDEGNKGFHRIESLGRGFQFI
ncbi:hypothetical protein D3C79_1088090 [compost metagenome]